MGVASVRGGRRAFTLVEVLVVIAIITLLISMLMPAIQKVREAANKAICGNNLKQMGIAVHNFHNDYGHIPNSRLRSQYATWCVEILQYLEQDNFYKEWALDRTYYDQPASVRGSQVKLYFCPTRRSINTQPRLSISGDVPMNGVPSSNEYPGALCDYACSIGCGTFDYWWGQWPANGTFVYGGMSLSFSAVKDGLSNTIFIGEKHVPIDRWGQQYWDGCAYNGEYGASFRYAGQGHALALTLQEQSFVYGSYHPNVVQFVFGDGSVRGLLKTISSDTLGALATRADGEVIPDDFEG